MLATSADSPPNLSTMLVICDSCDLSHESHIPGGLIWLAAATSGLPFWQRRRGHPQGTTAGRCGARCARAERRAGREHVHALLRGRLRPASVLTLHCRTRRWCDLRWPSLHLHVGDGCEHRSCPIVHAVHQRAAGLLVVVDVSRRMHSLQL